MVLENDGNEDEQEELNVKEYNKKTHEKVPTMKAHFPEQKETKLFVLHIRSLSDRHLGAKKNTAD